MNLTVDFDDASTALSRILLNNVDKSKSFIKFRLSFSICVSNSIPLLLQISIYLLNMISRNLFLVLPI